MEVTEAVVATVQTVELEDGIMVVLAEEAEAVLEAEEVEDQEDSYHFIMEV